MKSYSNSLHKSFMLRHARPVSHDVDVYVFPVLYLSVDIGILTARIEDEDAFTHPLVNGALIQPSG